MPDRPDLSRVTSAYMKAMALAVILGCFLFGLTAGILRASTLSLGGVAEILWRALMIVLFAGPWLYLAIGIVLFPLALLIYFSMRRVLVVSTKNAALLSASIGLIFFLIVQRTAFLEIDPDLGAVSFFSALMPSSILFGVMFSKFVELN